MEFDEFENHIQLFDALLGPDQASNRETRFDYNVGRDTRPHSLRPGREFKRIEITTRNSNYNPVKFSWFYHSIDDRSKWYLTSLSLRGLGLSRINYGVLEMLSHLEYLDLQGNDLSFFELNSPKNTLHTINLASNQITKLNVQFSVICPNLRILTLHSNGLSEFQCKFLAGNSELNKLVLSKNNITNIDLSYLGDLQYLLNIDVSENKLSSFEYFGRNKELRSLLLHQNSLQQFSIEGHLPKLQLITLYENQIDHLNLNGYQNITPNLSRLYLWGNLLKQINLSDHLSLKELNLAGNELTMSTFLQYLPQLQRANLSYNLIEKIDFKEVPDALENLDLSANPITKVDLQNIGNIGEIVVNLDKTLINSVELLDKPEIMINDELEVQILTIGTLHFYFSNNVKVCVVN